MAICYKPRMIPGPWTQGRVLDLYSLPSARKGSIDTDVGALVHRLKYGENFGALPYLVRVSTDFICKWDPRVTAIVPVPASEDRAVQPVEILCEELAEALGLPALLTAIRRERGRKALKNIADPEERSRELDGAFRVSTNEVWGHRLLLVDDVYDSGATMTAISRELAAAGAAAVYSFALTETRTKS